MSNTKKERVLTNWDCQTSPMRNTDPTVGKSHEETGHTPGPWEVSFFHSNPKTESPYYKIDSEREGIAHVYDSEANARLIAAAPQLLEQLKTAYVDLTILHIGDSGEWKRSDKAARMRAAIQQAENPQLRLAPEPLPRGL